MENKPKINVKRFSRSKVLTEDTPTEEPIVEKKTRGRKKKVTIEEPEITIEEPEPIIDEPEPIIEEPETFEVDDDFLSELNNTTYKKEIEEYNKQSKLKLQFSFVI